MGTKAGGAYNEAALLEDALQKVAPYKVNGMSLVHRAVQDSAASRVARVCGLEVENCLMHSGDKPGAWAVGMLTKTKDGQPVDPFPEACQLINKCRVLAELVRKTDVCRNTFEQSCGIMSCPFLKPDLALCTTRIAPVHSLLCNHLRVSMRS